MEEEFFSINFTEFGLDFKTKYDFKNISPSK